MLVLRQSVSVAALLAVLGCASPSPEEVFEREMSSDTSEQIVDSLILAAEASERSGDWAGAAQYWGNLLTKDPTNARYALGLGTALRHTGQFGESVQVLRDALPHNPDSPELLAAYGKSLLAAGYQSDAVIELQKASVQAPTDWRVQSALGVAFGMSGDMALAEQHYRQALVLSPGNPTVLSNYGLHKAINGDMGAGLTLLSEAASSLDATVQVRQNYALLLALSGDMEAAEVIVRSDLIPEAADRQLAYFESLRGQSLDNLENYIGQGVPVIETEVLAATEDAGTVVNLTNIDTNDPDAFLAEADEIVIVEPVLNEPQAAEPAEAERVASVEEIDEMPPEIIMGGDLVIAPLEDAQPEGPASEPEQAGDPVIAMAPDQGDELLVIVPQESVLPATADSDVVVLPSPPLESSLVVEPGDGQGTTTELPSPPVESSTQQRFYRVQLASLASEQAAVQGRDQLLRELAGTLGGTDVAIAPGTLANGDTTWRVLAGTYDRQADANALCAAIKAAGSDCYVRRDPAP